MQFHFVIVYYYYILYLLLVIFSFLTLFLSFHDSLLMIYILDVMYNDQWNPQILMPNRKQYKITIHMRMKEESLDPGINQYPSVVFFLIIFSPYLYIKLGEDGGGDDDEHSKILFIQGCVCKPHLLLLLLLHFCLFLFYNY